VERRIQYVTTPDGVSIAYYEAGQGPPFVYLNLPFSHLTEEEQWIGPSLKAISSASRLVRYDPRGFGLSERDPVDVSLDAYERDLETVVDRLELRQFILFGAVAATPIAISYAAKHPERVSHLILYMPAARAPQVLREQIPGLFAAGMGDWRFISEALARIAEGWERPEESAVLAHVLRESATLEQFTRFQDSYVTWDVTHLLPHVQARTLVLCSKDHAWSGVNVGREVAARIPRGELSVIEAVGDAGRRETANAIYAFLGAPASRQLSGEPGKPQSATDTAVILFTDIADSTALTERLGDAPFRAASRSLDEGIRQAMRDANGAAVEGKVLGDGVMGVFPSAAQAIDAARRCVAASAAAELPLHIGVHAGDVIREQDNVYGGAVNIASRICAMCEPGEILVSQTVRDLARTSAGVTFEDRGEHALKGVADPVRVFAVRPRE